MSVIRIRVTALALAVAALLCLLPAGTAKAYTNRYDFTQGSNGMILIGDSRTVGMHIAVGKTNDTWSCKDSMGYSWMVNTGVPEVEDEIGEGSNIIILMGVNDLYEVDKYVTYINQKAKEWKELGARTWFCSVGPMVDDPKYMASNAQIEKFNETLQEDLVGVNYIDIYSSIEDDFETMDGLHYRTETYLKIYRLIQQHVGQGFVTAGGKTYFIQNDAYVTGWITYEGRRYHMDAQGVLQTGWQKIDGRWYYLGEDGMMRTGKVTTADGTFYLNANGSLSAGVQQPASGTYVTDGSMLILRGRAQ